MTHKLCVHPCDHTFKITLPNGRRLKGLSLGRADSLYDDLMCDWTQHCSTQNLLLHYFSFLGTLTQPSIRTLFESRSLEVRSCAFIRRQHCVSARYMLWIKSLLFMPTGNARCIFFIFMFYLISFAFSLLYFTFRCFPLLLNISDSLL